MHNWHLVLNKLNNNLQDNFGEHFKYANSQHQHHAREPYNNKIYISHAKTIHDLQSIKYKPTKDWVQKELKRINFNNVMNTCLQLLNTKFSKGFKEYFSDNGNQPAN